MARSSSELVADVERRLEEIETLEDAPARAKATGIVQALLELYGAGLERIVDEVAARDDGALAHAFTQDELISHLLLLHGLHPVSLEDRVLDALAEVRPYLESHGGNVELLAVEEPTVRLRLQGSCSGCPSSTMTLKLAIENAIRKAAPEIEEVIAHEAKGASDLLQIELAPGMRPAGDWLTAGALPDVAAGRPAVKRVGGRPILFLALDGRFYAYRPECPACGEALEDAPLLGVALTCPGCGNRYDVLRAGRGLDDPQLQLEPVPLLVDDDGLVKVALALPA